MVHTGPTLRQHAKDMRRFSTRAEDRLWEWLRGRRFDGYKFKRQFPIDRYVLDFYCPELKLAIELDGRQHEDILTSQYDYERDAVLGHLGIVVLRITNELLICEAEIVEQQIRYAIEAFKVTSCPGTRAARRSRRR